MSDEKFEMIWKGQPYNDEYLPREIAIEIIRCMMLREKELKENINKILGLTSINVR